MSGSDYWKEGDWNAVCSLCGRKRKASEMAKNWQGMYRCPSHNEPRHPQDFVRAVPDIQTPPWVQPPSDTFVSLCFPCDTTAIPALATPGCVKPAFISPMCELAAGLGNPPATPNVISLDGPGLLSLFGLSATVTNSPSPTTFTTTTGLLTLAGLASAVSIGCSSDGSSSFPNLAIPGCSIPNQLP